MVRAVGMPISVGIIASISYARAKGVFLVGCPGVVRLAHRTLGNSSTHFSLAFSSFFFFFLMWIVGFCSLLPLAHCFEGTVVWSIGS